MYRLRVVSVVPKQRGFLSETVEAMNSKAVLHAEASPRKGAPKFANVSRAVERTSPEFFTELQACLKQYHDLTLKPVSK